jgi:hypothetical protein
MRPYAACYGGHQFGNWAGQLGDGRAITLGELVARDGSAGRCSSRARAHALLAPADGRAVLRSSLREFLCSEAMHHLGVPTTRALALVADRRAGRARHVLRRQPASPSRARSSAASRRRSCASATSSCRRARRHALLRGSVDFTIRARLPGTRWARRAGADARGVVRTRSCARTARDDRALDARRLRARRDEHRQHVDPRPHDRLRPVRLARRLRSRLDAQHHRRRRAGATASAHSRRWRLWNLERLASRAAPLVGP